MSHHNSNFGEQTHPTAWMDYFQCIQQTTVVADAYRDLADGSKIICLTWEGRKLWMHRSGSTLEYALTSGHDMQRPLLDRNIPYTRDDVQEALRVLFAVEGEPGEDDDEKKGALCN